MPNTGPPLDDAAVVSSVLLTGEAAGLCEVASSGCITVGREGEQLAPMGELYALGVGSSPTTARASPTPA